ncbi:hypothetical protein [Pseudolysinimonas sp.]
MPRLRSALAAPAALLALVLAPAGLAHAETAEGSVPSEVRTYVVDGSLTRQLEDVYGLDAAGNGVDFDPETTTTGTIERVHVWSEALRAGDETDHPVDITNQWIVPVLIAEQPVGVATIWINPATVLPELASFDADADLATALSGVADGSSLVHDVESLAWLALAEDGTLTPLVPGRTGLSTPVPIDDIALLPAETAPPQGGGDPGTGVGLAIAVLLLLLAVIVVALVVPTVRGTRAEKRKASEEAEEEAEPAVVAAAPTKKALPAATKTPDAAAGAEEKAPVAKKRPPKSTPKPTDGDATE